MDRRFVAAVTALLAFGLIGALLAQAVTSAVMMDLDAGLFGMNREAAAGLLINISFVVSLVGVLAVLFASFVEPKEEPEA